MAIRLNKIMRELNIGLETAVNILLRNGQIVLPNLSYKLTDEQADILYREISHRPRITSTKAIEKTEKISSTPNTRENEKPLNEFDGISHISLRIL